MPMALSLAFFLFFPGNLIRKAVYYIVRFLKLGCFGKKKVRKKGISLTNGAFLSLSNSIAIHSIMPFPCILEAAKVRNAWQLSSYFFFLKEVTRIRNYQDCVVACERTPPAGFTMKWSESKFDLTGKEVKINILF